MLLFMRRILCNLIVSAYVRLATRDLAEKKFWRSEEICSSKTTHDVTEKTVDKEVRDIDLSRYKLYSTQINTSFHQPFNLSSLNKNHLKKSRSCQSLFLAQKKLKRARIERKKKRFELIWTINFYDQKRNRIKETAFHFDSFSFNKVITTTWINF